MAQFSRRTIAAAADYMAEWFHTEINRFVLEHGLEETIEAGSRADRAIAMARHLIRNPDALNEDGNNLSDAVVTDLILRAASRCYAGYPASFDLENFEFRFAGIRRGLERDGFMIDDGTLRPMLPQAIDLPAADSEVHVLLDRYAFAISRGHLDQGISAHARGEWAGANAQFRVFIESLFDAIAARLANGIVAPTGGQSRIWLANRTPSFFVANLNEWTGNGQGFIEGFIRRLHPEGAHPGLSDEEDSTFRLHLVLLVGRLLLRRVGQVQ
jgi:hypothetical protein